MNARGAGVRPAGRLCPRASAYPLLADSPPPGGAARRASTALVSAALLTLSACGGEVPGPLPRVVSTAPAGEVDPERVEVVIGFSAPLAAEGIEDGRWVTLCRKDDLRAVVLQAEGEEGLPGAAPVVPTRASLREGGTEVVLTPAAPLAPGGSWAAVLSRRARSADGRPVLDAEGKPRTVAVFFETGPDRDRTPPVARWVTPPHGPVPRDVATLELAFDEPVVGALLLAAPAAGTGAGAGSPASSHVASAPGPGGEDVPGLTRFVTPGAILSPGPLALDLAGVHDESGNPAAAPPLLEVSTCASAGPPALAGAPHATPGTLSVRLDGATLGMGRLVAEVSARPGEPACGTALPPPSATLVRGPVGACWGWDPCHPAAQPCLSSLELTGLCPGRAVGVRLATEDLAGHRGSFGSWAEVRSEEARAAPVVTEVLADADAPEAGGEYVEVANLGTAEADLSGWALAKRGPSGAFTRCALDALSGGPVPAAGFALVVGGAYDGRYALPPGVPLYTCGRAALLGGLANDRPVALALEDAQGAVVSTVGIAEPAPRCPTGALERRAPAAEDTAASFACPGTRSPGACNASTPPEQCPRRAW